MSILYDFLLSFFLFLLHPLLLLLKRHQGVSNFVLAGVGRGLFPPLFASFKHSGRNCKRTELGQSWTWRCSRTWSSPASRAARHYLGLIMILEWFCRWISEVNWEGQKKMGIEEWDWIAFRYLFQLKQFYVCMVRVLYSHLKTIPQQVYLWQVPFLRLFQRFTKLHLLACEQIGLCYGAIQHVRQRAMPVGSLSTAHPFGSASPPASSSGNCWHIA